MMLPLFHWAKHIGWHEGNSSTRSVGGSSATQTPGELHSVLRINPYNWTFPNCNISFILDQSTNKTTNKWLLQVAYGKTCSTLGALLFAWQKQNKNNNIVSVVRKVRAVILLADLVCCEVQCLPRSAHLKIFLIFVIWWRRFKSAYTFLFVFCCWFFHQLLLAQAVFFFASFFFYYYLSIFLHLTKTVFCRKPYVSLCFVVSTGEYISLVLFYQFCQPHQ